MLVLKKKYRGVTMSNGKLGKFNTNDIDKGNELYYFNNGLEHIFDEVCDKCEKKKCVCND